MKKFFLVETAVVIIFSMALYLLPLKHYSFQTADFSSEEAVHMDGLYDVGEGYYVDNSMVQEKGKDEDGREMPWATISSPEVDLRFGSYNITLHYLTNDRNNTYTCSSLYNTIPVILRRKNISLDIAETDNRGMTFTLNSPLNVDGYKVTYNFTGNGYLYAYGLEIQETNWWKAYVLLWLITIFIVADLIIYWIKKQNTEALGAFAVVLVLAVLSSLPIFDPYIITGHDFYFHAGRIEALAEAMRNGQIPARISSAWLNGKGYAASIFYCDLFMTLPAVLCVLGGSIQFAFKVYIFGINILTSYISVKCFSKIFKTKMQAILASAIFVLAPYRLTCLYVRAAAGEYTAMAFLPLIFWGLLKIYSDESESGTIKDKLLRVLPLAIGVSGVVSCHVLSCVIVALFAVVFALVQYKKTFTVKVITDLVCTVVMVVLINFWYIVPFLQIMHDGIRAAAGHFDGRFRANASYLWQLFSLFPNIGISSSIDESLPEGGYGEMSASIGAASWVLLLYVVLRCFKYIDKTKDEKGVRITDSLAVVAAFSIFMETEYFPWDAVKQFSGVTDMIVTNIQFPFRFLSITMLCLAVLSGYVCEQMKDHSDIFLGVMIAAVLISSNYFTSLVGKEGSFVYLPDKYTGYGVMGAEYLPKGIAHDYEGINEPTSEEGIEIHDWYRHGGKIYVNVTNDTAEEKLLNVPFIYYRGYRAQTDSKENLGILKNDDAFVGVAIPGNFEGNVCVYYSEPLLWRLSEVVSLLAVVFIFVLWMRNTYVRNISGMLGVS